MHKPNGVEHRSKREATSRMSIRCIIVALGRRVTYPHEVELEELDVHMKTVDELFVCRRAGEDLTISHSSHNSHQRPSQKILGTDTLPK